VTCSTPTCATDVLEGLRSHATDARTALRCAELARRLGLGRGNVAVALAWLANRPDSRVLRRKTDAEIWDKYWFAPEDACQGYPGGAVSRD
jgi:hypothetical protein